MIGKSSCTRGSEKALCYTKLNIQKTFIKMKFVYIFIYFFHFGSTAPSENECLLPLQLGRSLEILAEKSPKISLAEFIEISHDKVRSKKIKMVRKTSHMNNLLKR